MSVDIQVKVMKYSFLMFKAEDRTEEEMMGHCQTKSMRKGRPRGTHYHYLLDNGLISYGDTIEVVKTKR